MSIRAIVVDDMKLARKRLIRQLARHPDVEVIAECANGEEAFDVIRAQRPQLVFLDIEMPEQGGFELVQRLEDSQCPEIVFVTAYDQFAIQAFEVHAVDYLLKPFSPERLEKALARVRRRLSEDRRAPDSNMTALLQTLSRQLVRSRPLVIRVDGTTMLIRQPELDWVESAGNYVKVHSGKEHHLVRETMADIEQRLDPQNFVRIHRSIIVNILRIKEIRSLPTGNYELLLRDGQVLPLSRTHKRKLSELLEGM